MRDERWNFNTIYIEAFWVLIIKITVSYMKNFSKYGDFPTPIFIGGHRSFQMDRGPRSSVLAENGPRSSVHGPVFEKDRVGPRSSVLGPFKFFCRFEPKDYYT